MISLKRYKPYIIWVVITLLFAVVGSVLSGSSEMYASLQKPPLSPPAIVFPIAWTVLYILMGIAAGGIAKSNDLDKANALKIYLLQLVVNIIWPIIFFRFEAIKFALFWLLLLIILVFVTFKAFKSINSKSAYLLLPYIAWLLFAFYLNLGVIALNS